ncbi:ribosome biogenesis regulatory protein homolog [Panulirus ornatus]|uniref:ribosome biogenesis regulatory protein homolog n=1 Tax=Panulirus ornatus TaxID=150431 RepID=UPI003A8B50B7
MKEDTTILVNSIITQATEELKFAEVHKDIQSECDKGNLVVTIKNSLNESSFRDPEKSDAYLSALARDGLQSLFAEVWDLPREWIDSAVFVTLPKPSTRLPREKPMPKNRFISKWEQYARDKGIQRKKRAKKTWDDVLKQWVPRYGYRKVKAEKEKNWVKEVPDHGDPYEDQFFKAAELKKENIAKNEYQRLRNIARNRKLRVPHVGVTNNEYSSIKDLGLAMHHARHATASLGKFQPDLPNERKVKGLGKKRRQEQTTGDGQVEKKQYIEAIKKVDKPQLNLDGAIHKQIKDENIRMDIQRTGGKKHPRRSKMGGRHRTKSDHRTDKLGKGFNKLKEKAKGKVRGRAKVQGKKRAGMGKGKDASKAKG